jgi:flagellar export protein FliJ
MGVVAGVEQRMQTAGDALRECEDLGCTNVPHAPLLRAVAAGLVRHRQRLQRELRAAEARLDRARGDWLTSRQEHRALLQLRDRHAAKFRAGLLAREQREIEELWRPAAGAAGQEEAT